MTNQKVLESDRLAVGLTRPAMLMGVAIKVLFFILFFCSLLYVYIKTFLVVPVGVLLYFLALLLSIKEPRFYEFWLRYANKTPRNLSSVFWGKTNSYEPW